MRPLIAISLCALTLVLGACKSSMPQRTERFSDPVATGLVIGNQGGASDVVFSHPRVAESYAGWSDRDRPEFDRNDAVLSARTAAAITWRDEWPVPERPTLERQRRGRTISGNRNTFIYYIAPR